MNSREAILQRVREALRVPAPPPGSHAPVAPQFHGRSSTGRERSAAQPSPGPEPSQWLPAVGDGLEEQLRAFATASQALRTDFQVLERGEDPFQRLRTLSEAEGWKRTASHRGEWTEAACKTIGLPVLWTDQPYDKTELERCDAAITQCDGLVAQTGSVLITGRSAGGRALSVLPPHHVVIATRDQVIRDLPAAFELLRRKYAPDYPSFMTLITGPSRTGDIERILVLGAHGPRKLTVFCV